jgi:non-specific serine/threonine protein kinase
MRRDLGDKQGLAEGLEGMAYAAAGQGQAARAARLFGAVEALREALGAPIFPCDRADHERHAAMARRALGEGAFDAARAAGRALPLDDAVAYALSAEDPVPAGGRRTANRSGDPLTPREREVAALLARGYTDRRIAEALVITEGTAGVHVEHILTKLGFRSRAQVAVWAAGRGLLNEAP